MIRARKRTRKQKSGGWTIPERHPGVDPGVLRGGGQRRGGPNPGPGGFFPGRPLGGERKIPIGGAGAEAGARDKTLAIQQIESSAVTATGIANVLVAMGFGSSNPSILSDESFALIENMEERHLAPEALNDIIDERVRSLAATNLARSRTFLERPRDAMSRHENDALSTAETPAILIQLAKDMSEAKRNDDRRGPSSREIVFFDALAERPEALESMDEPALENTAKELPGPSRATPPSTGPAGNPPGPA